MDLWRCGAAVRVQPVRGATAAWIEDDGSIHLEHAKTTLRNTLLDMLDARRNRVKNINASLDDLALAARAEIAAAMVAGDFSASVFLTELLHDAAQAAADSDGTRR